MIATPHMDEFPKDDDSAKTGGIRPIASISYGVSTLMRQCLALFGLILIPISIVIGFLTPFLPIGLPIGILGVFLLGRYSVWGREWMESVLRRHPTIERLAPNRLMKVVFGREKRIISEPSANGEDPTSE